MRELMDKRNKKFKNKLKPQVRLAAIQNLC